MERQEQIPFGNNKEVGRGFVLAHPGHKNKDVARAGHPFSCRGRLCSKRIPFGMADKKGGSGIGNGWGGSRFGLGFVHLAWVQAGRARGSERQPRPDTLFFRIPFGF